MVEIIIKNCNSIDEANIKIEKNKLNIKYGINGTGKTTIAKAILEHSTDNLIDLLPFKYRDNNPDNIVPIVENADEFVNIVIFNEEYINQFVYLEDELLENSFEIFIKDEEYKENLEEIEKLFSNVKTVFQQNSNLDEIINDLNVLGSAFSSTKGGISKSSKIIKAFGNGNKIKNIPKGLEEYSEYINSSQNTSWIQWQTSGNEFIGISTKCPYCTSPTENKTDTIAKVADEFDHNSIKHLLNITKVMDSLKIYFTEDTQSTIDDILKNSTGLDESDESFLKMIKEQIDILKTELIKLQQIAFFTFDNVPDMSKMIEELKVKLTRVPALNSSETQTIIDPLNTSIDELLEKAGILQGKIKGQKGQITRKIIQYEKEINSFLEFSGYKYIIDIKEIDQEYKLQLKHIDLSETVSKGSQHLSYGEKNAFALILFMYECLSKNPDLIILDDPISSFDKNKKFAIMDKLFRKESTLKDKTVLMLTHDIDPIVDIVKIFHGSFAPLPVASFLKSKNGIIEELNITKDDLKTFAQVCFENITNNSEIITRLIYLRRYHEVLDDKGIEYQLLASLFKKRDVPTKYTQSGEEEMSSEEINDATEAIKLKVADFKYSLQVTTISNVNILKQIYNECSNNYEKLQLFRMIFDIKKLTKVMQKYINETYHIENEYVSQLNPSKYEMIPEFIIEECNNAMDNS